MLLKVFNSHFTSMEKWVISWSQVPQPLSFKNQKEVFFIENTPKSVIILPVATASATWDVRNPNPVP